MTCENCTAAPQVLNKDFIKQVFYFDTISGTNASLRRRKGFVEGRVLCLWSRFYKQGQCAASRLIEACSPRLTEM